MNDAVIRGVTWLKGPVDRYGSTKIRHFYWLASSGVQVLLLHGWRVFFNRFRRYRQNERNVLRWRSQLDKGAGWKVAVRVETGQYRLPKKPVVAVVVHAFYPDVFAEICSYLKNMPVTYTLLVSVVSEQAAELVRRQSSGLPLMDKCIVKVVENRGRDIKPFLVDFAPELGHFDYICKVHTKKSLFTGAEKMDRRQYLCEMVLGSRQRIQAILTVFAREASVGIVYPARYEEMPYWCYTWLSNKPVAGPIVNKLGLDFDPDEYIDYPSGSMFWCRREALRPLFDLRLGAADFPEEKGQNDGALQHVIERCFALSACTRGLKYAVINGLKEDVFSFSETMKIAPYFNASAAERIRDGLTIVDVVSFDLFDTLLCRPFASPGMVFQYMEETVRRRWGIGDFARLRQDAESSLRKRQGPSGDVKISQIYLELAGEAGVSPDIAQEILQLELETEIKNVVPRRDMISSFEEAKKKGKRVIIVTDTYFEREHIERILEANGITGSHRLYISCEEGRRKSRGDMWEHVIESEGIKNGSFLHAGDNEQADLQMLIDRGPYSTVHVMKPSVLFRQSPFGRELWQTLNPRKGWRENLLYGMISNYFCLDTYPYDFWYGDRPLGDPFSLGYTVFGPLMHNFMAWLVKRVRRDGIKRLYFLSREGYVLQKIYRDIAAADDVKQAGIELPAGRYLLCSRRTCLFAGLGGKEGLLTFLDKHFDGTLGYFFEKRLYIDAQGMQAIGKLLGEDALGRQVSLPADRDRLRDILFDVFDIIYPQAEEEREALLGYCRGEGMMDEGEIGLVDIGYSCTMQRALTGLLGRRMHGYYFAIDKKTAGAGDGGLPAYGYLGETGDREHDALAILKYNLLLEAVLTAPEGQLVRFAGGESGVAPVFKQAGLPQRKFDIIERIHDGMRAFVRDMHGSFGAGMLDIEFPVQELLFYYQMIATGRIDIGGLGEVLSVEDEYCGTPEVKVIGHYIDMEKRGRG